MAQDQEFVEILVPEAVSKDMPAFLNNEAITSIRDFERPNSRRDTIDFVLLYQALVRGGIYEKEIRLVQHTNESYNRLFSNLRSGRYTVFSNTIWREDISNSDTELAVSVATLSDGHYEAGLYMNPNNPKFAKPVNLSELTAVSSKQWRPDWLALEQLPLKHLYQEVNWENMLKMVHSQRVDFMLIPFSRQPNLEQTALGITLKPIANVKIALAGSRGWAMSQTHSRAKDTVNAVNMGLQQMQREGIIKRAYIDAGIINPRVSNWTLLNANARQPLSNSPKTYAPESADKKAHVNQSDRDH